MKNASWAIFACLLWSTAFVGVKVGLKYSTPLSLAGIRFMLSGLLLLPFCGPFRRVIRSVVADIRQILWVSFFQTFILYGLFFIGMTMISGALGAIVIGAAPLFSAVTAHFLMPDDEMTWRKGLSIGLGILGIVIISLSREPWSASGWKEFLGVMMLTGGCVASAVGNTIVARDTRIHPLTLNSAQIFLGGLGLFIVSLFVEGPPKLSQPLTYYGALIWLALLSTVSVSIWFSLLKRPEVKVSELNLWKFIIPVLGAILSWLLLPGESPEWLPIIGMFCVAVSILYYNLSSMAIEKRRRLGKDRIREEASIGT